jgi:hypothetical protein
MDRGNALMLEIHRTAKTNSARPYPAVRLAKEGSAQFPDAFQHPDTPTGMQRVALRKQQPATLEIEEGKAEMGPPDVNGQYGMW